MPLNDFCRVCDATKEEWRRQYPRANFSNGRYAAYIEDVYRRGIAVPPEIIATLSADDLRYDAHAFPHLAPKLGIKL